ncbi:hypothetical protein V8G54_028950 [Vigna mungo]|uniref:Uncharacterized protein n=1 Tax=Vigna mungo TaxID=3915 RepID=A0AAQ3MTV7_VIGMU
MILSFIYIYIYIGLMRCALSLTFHVLDKVRHSVCFGKRLNQIPKCVLTKVWYGSLVLSLSQFRINVFVFLLFIYRDASKVLWIKKEEDLVAFNGVSVQNCMLSAITTFAFLSLQNGIQRVKIQAKCIVKKL